MEINEVALENLRQSWKEIGMGSADVVNRHFQGFSLNPLQWIGLNSRLPQLCKTVLAYELDGAHSSEPQSWKHLVFPLENSVLDQFCSKEPP